MHVHRQSCAWLSQNHGMLWFGMDLKDHPLPALVLSHVHLQTHHWMSNYGILFDMNTTLGVSSDIVGQARLGHVYNPALRGAGCLGQPGEPPAEPQGVVCPTSPPTLTGSGSPSIPLGHAHPTGNVGFPPHQTAPITPKNPPSALTKESCGSPYWIRPKVSKTKITNIK